MDQLPEHLGGHEQITHLDRGALKYLMDTLNAESFLDIGCGPGGMVDLAKKRGLIAVGIDGDFTLKETWKRQEGTFFIHDFAKGRFLGLQGPFDIGYSVEFLEHVDEEFIPNYFPLFQLCKYVVVTHAVPGQGGHHHVNCQNADYWIQKFSEYGLMYSDIMTKELRAASKMRKPFMQRTGLVFINTSLVNMVEYDGAIFNEADTDKSEGEFNPPPVLKLGGGKYDFFDGFNAQHGS